jgi:hypothetical protein
MAKAGTELLPKSCRKGRMLKKEMVTVVRGYCGSLGMAIWLGLSKYLQG